MHALSRRPSALRSRSLRLVAASLHHVALSIFMDRIEQAKVMLMQLVRSGLAAPVLAHLLAREPRSLDAVAVIVTCSAENSTTAHLNRFSLSAAGQPFQNLPGAEMYLPTAVAGLLSVG